MKKLISLLLVVMMLCSISTVAFAADTKIGVSDATTEIEKRTSGTADTQVWLQVKAEGQIDVTVPLVVVFQTNIDGGNATAADNYKITNNGYTPLTVTGVKVVENNNTGDHKTTLNVYDTIAGDPTNKDYLDNYGVTLSDGTTTLDAKTIVDKNDDDTEKKSALEGGLFKLKAMKADDTTGMENKISVAVATGKLSFVTEQTTGTDGNQTVNEAKGVKILTFTYTVAIDGDPNIAATSGTYSGTIDATDGWEGGADNVPVTP